jgi:hypothetical protein
MTSQHINSLLSLSLIFVISIVFCNFCPVGLRMGDPCSTDQMLNHTFNMY